MLHTTSAGPWFYARVEPGIYNISAGARGITVGTVVTVGEEETLELYYC